MKESVQTEGFSIIAIYSLNQHGMLQKQSPVADVHEDDIY